MPIYAYRCSACGHAKDVLQKLSDAALATCPACGAESFAKQLTAAGFQLKGSGWYATDFKGNGAAKKPAEADAAKPADGGAGKPAEKPADKPADKSAERPADKPGTSSASSGGGGTPQASAGCACH